MEVSTTQAAALIGKSERSVQRYIKTGKLPARPLPNGGYVVNVADLESLRGDQADIEALRIEVEALKQRVTELETIVQALRSSPGTKPRTSSVVPQKTEGPGTALPEGLVSWRTYAKERSIPETTAQRAIDAGKIQIVPGRWKVGHAVITQALDEAGRKQFDEHFGLV